VYHSYRVTADTPQYRQDIGQQKSFKFISYDNLTTTDLHKLVVKVTECVNQTFTFDYLTYTYVLPPRRVPVLILNPGDQKMTKKTKIALISGNVSGFIILLLGAVFIIMRRRNRYKHPRRKLTYYLKSFLLLKKTPRGFTGPFTRQPPRGAFTDVPHDNLCPIPGAISHSQPQGQPPVDGQIFNTTVDGDLLPACTDVDIDPSSRALGESSPTGVIDPSYLA